MFSLQTLEEEICQHKPTLQSAQNAAKELLDRNRDNPHVCAKINERLSTASVPLANLLKSLEDKQKRLDRVKKAVVKYEEQKAPLEEFLTEANTSVEEAEPFGIDLEKGEEQVTDLKVWNIKQIFFNVLYRLQK